MVAAGVEGTRGDDGRSASETAARRLWRLRSGITLGLLLLLIVLGAAGFVLLEGFTPLDAVYLTVSTIATVGYGDLHPATSGGKLVAMSVAVSGLVLVTVGASLIIDALVRGRIQEALRRPEDVAKARRLSGHTIICGYGEVGRAAVKELLAADLPVLVIERDHSHVADLPSGAQRIIGDADRNEVLEQAGIDRATVLLATAHDDADNLLIIATAKGLNPKIATLSRGGSQENVDKLQKVGADLVVFPELEAGRSLAAAVEKEPGPVIVCGYGRTGQAVVEALVQAGRELVIVHDDEEALKRVPKDLRIVRGNPTEKKTLEEAGLGEAAGVICALDDDGRNLMALVGTRFQRPTLRVVAQAVHPENTRKMERLGATAVVSPEGEAGRALADWAKLAHDRPKP